MPNILHILIINYLLLLILNNSHSTSMNDFDNTSLNISSGLVERAVGKVVRDDLYFIVIACVDSPQPDIVDEFMKHLHINNISIAVLNINNSSVILEDYQQLGRSDTTENSVGFIFLTGQLTGRCFVDNLWTRYPFWNPRAFFLLVVTTPVSKVPDVMTLLFRDCWDKYNLLNIAALLIIPSGREGRAGVSMMTYNNFRDKLTVVRMGHDEDAIITGKGILTDLNGHDIEVRIPIVHPLLIDKLDSNGDIYLSGPDGHALNAILGKMNATMRYFYQPPRENHLSEKDDTSKGLHAISCMLFSTWLNKMAYPHGCECLTAVVPKAKKMPKYMNMILPFSKKVWAISFSGMLTIAIFWKFISSVDSLDKECHESNGVVLETIRLLILGGTLRDPKFFVQRLVIASCLIFNIVVISSYQGSLTSYLTISTFYPDLNTIQELLDSDLKISTFISLEDVEAVSIELDFEDPLMIRLFDRLVLNPNETEVLHMVAVHRNISSLSSHFIGVYQANSFEYYKDGYPLLHVIDDCYISIPTSFIAISSNCPYLVKIGDLISRIVHGGFMAKWKSDFIKETLKSSNSLKIGDDPTPIENEHLTAPYFCLGFGLLVSIVAFSFELVSVRRCNLFGK